MAWGATVEKFPVVTPIERSSSLFLKKKLFILLPSVVYTTTTLAIRRCRAPLSAPTPFAMPVPAPSATLMPSRPRLRCRRPLPHPPPMHRERGRGEKLWLRFNRGCGHERGGGTRAAALREWAKHRAWAQVRVRVQAWAWRMSKRVGVQR